MKRGGILHANRALLLALALTLCLFSACSRAEDEPETPPTAEESSVPAPSEIPSADTPAAASGSLSDILSSLAEKFDAASLPPDFGSLTNFLSENAAFSDFDGLKDRQGQIISLLSSGFDVTSSRERILVHWVLADGVRENDPSADTMKKALFALDSINDNQYALLLDAIASHRDSILDKMMPAGTYEDSSSPLYPESMAISVLLRLFPAFPAETGENRYQIVKNNGETADLVLRTDMISGDMDDTLVLFTLTCGEDSYEWEYRVSGTKVSLSSQGVSYHDALAAIYG